MNDPIEHTPTQLLDCIVLVTLIGSDRMHRARFWERKDHLVQYSIETLRDEIDQNQRYKVWRSEHPVSGLFEDFSSALADSQRKYDWMNDVEAG